MRKTVLPRQARDKHRESTQKTNACLVGVDSGNLVSTLAAYMSGLALNLWSQNGTVKPVDPDSTMGMSCNYSICSELDYHRCRNMMRGLPGGIRARSFGVPCTVPFEPPQQEEENVLFLSFSSVEKADDLEDRLGTIIRKTTT
jgi:hypothetical protein